MAKRLSSVLGVDIGSRKIKVAEIKAQGKQPVVSALGMIDTPDGAVDHTGIFNSEAVGVALKQLIGQSGVTVGQVVVSIAGQASVLVRTLEVPRMTPAELNEHMQWEINRNIPFAESNVLSDFKQLEDEDPTSPNMEVVMAIAPQSAVDTVLAAVKKAGKGIAAIDVQALAVARSLKTSYEDIYEGQTVCMVDVGHKTTSINIYKDGRLLLPRQVPVGGEMFTRAIADALGIGMEEAELLKQQKCHVHPELLQPSIPDPFGFGGTTSMGATPAAPSMTQEFQPYNPFSEEPTHAAPEPATFNPEPAPFAAHPFEDAPNTSDGHTAEQMPPVAEGGEHFMEAPEPPVAEPHGQPVSGATLPPVAHAFDPFGGAEPPSTVPAPGTPLPDDNMPVPLGSTSGDPETQRVNNAIVSVLEEFVAEVRRSLDYFRSKGGAVDRVALSGGGSKLSGLAETLTQSLGVPCDHYDPLRHLNVSGKRIDPDFVEENKPDFAVAVGNALHIFFD